MSDWGEMIAELELRVREAVPGMPAGERGFTRGILVPDTLPESDYPHAFAHNPRDESTPDDWSEELVRVSVSLEVWFQGATQEAASASADVLSAAIRRDGTLGGLFDQVAIPLRGLSERADADFSAILAVIQGTRWR